MDQSLERNALSFLLELQKDYPHYLTSLPFLLHKHFGYEHIVLFPYNNMDIINYFGKSTLNTTDYASKYHKTFISYFQGLYSSCTQHNYYSETGYALDPFQPMNMPEYLRQRCIVRLFELIPPEEYYASEFYQTMGKELGVENAISLMLWHKEQIYGHLVIILSERGTDFSASELELLELIVPHIALNMQIGLDLKAHARNQNLMSTYYSNISEGFAILTGQYTLIEANEFIRQYSREIIEGIPPERRKGYATRQSPVVQLAQIIASDIEAMNLTRSKTFEIGLATYKCTMIPYFMSSMVSGMECLYILQIVMHIPEVNAAMQTTADRYSLTTREEDIVNLLARGYKNNEIAERLFISSHTVKAHISNIFKKVGVDSRTELLFKLKHQ